MEQKYLGIIPYDEDDSFEFAGRYEETWALYDRIIRNDYTVYYAASGEGKSSLIRAGLLPILRRRDYFPVYIVFEDKELCNISSIKDVIGNRIEIESVKHRVSYEQSAWSKSRFDIEQSEKLKDNLWWKLRNYCFKRGNVELKPLFIFDQFEEVFSKANYEWTDCFFEWLEEISTDYVPESLRGDIISLGIEMPTQKNYKALFSFRTEYLGDLDYWCVQKHFLPSLQGNRMCLKPLTPKGAREVIGLNESLLGTYGDKIIQGCSETKDSGNNNQPCVYALILSVVCQTLSEIPDKERKALLDNLNINQDNTIDDVLLRFYKKKLNEVGLDYIKDEKIIADIEDALVDEKGKRSRRDTDEVSLQSLTKWINRLSDKRNGLIKIIGKKEIDGKVINTVEFPHDRLCKAIDSSRKERQGKIAWKLKRQSEWMQFGIITAVIGIIAFLWNALMPALKPVIGAFLTVFKEETTINGEKKTIIIDGADMVVKEFFGKYIHGKSAEIYNISLDEGLSTILLMIFLAILLPLMTSFVIRKEKKWQVLSICTSFFGVILFGWLLYRNMTILFSSSYVNILNICGFLVSVAVFVVSCFRFNNLLRISKKSVSQVNSPSWWPLWGGYFIFALYALYEFIFRTTFGQSEPKDSSWAIIVLPLLYAFWAWGFFNINTIRIKKAKLVISFTFGVSVLIAICYISMMPFYVSIKQQYGISISCILIILYTAISGFVLRNCISESKYYTFSSHKRFFAVLFSFIVLLFTFIINLGYNPIVINSSTVCHVSSWRTVTIYKDSADLRYLGIKYARNGESIIPCKITIDDNMDSLLSIGKIPFRNDRIPINGLSALNPFLKRDSYYNNDNTFFWNSSDSSIVGYIPVIPTLEEYLMDSKCDSLQNIKDSINYYAAQLFNEIRSANINYITTNEKYDISALPSLEILDSLQQIAFKNELNHFVVEIGDSLFFPKDSTYSPPRTYIEVMEDRDLIDFHCELSRSFMLCLIKDRINKKDIPALFTLAKTYLLAFFTDVPAMHANCSFSIEKQSVFENGIKRKDISFEISSDDILNRKPFAWYDLFNALCFMDMGWNAGVLEELYANVLEGLSSFKTIEDDLFKMLKNGTQPFNFHSLGRPEDHFTVLSRYISNFLDSRKASRYEAIKGKLDSLNFVIKHEVTDKSLMKMKKQVISTLVAIMNERPTGMYNNDFENICQKLIMVSAFRGNDISADTTKLSGHLSEKGDFFIKTKMISEQLEFFQKQKNELVDHLNKLISILE